MATEKEKIKPRQRPESMRQVDRRRWTDKHKNDMVKVRCTRAKGDYEGIHPGREGMVPRYVYEGSNGMLALVEEAKPEPAPPAPQDPPQEPPQDPEPSTAGPTLQPPTEPLAPPVSAPDWRVLLKEAQETEDLERLEELSKDRRDSISSAAIARLQLLKD